MDNSKQKIFIFHRTWNEIFFLTVLLVYLVFSSIDNNSLLGEISIVAKICDVVKIILLLVLAVNAAIHIKTFHIRQIASFVVFGVLAAICFVVNRIIGPIVFLLFWVNIRDIEFKDILLVYLFAVGLIVLITIIGLIIGVIPDVIYDGLRHSFGFTHANTVGALTMTFIMCYVGYRLNQIKWYEFVICLVLAIIVFVFSRSKGAFGCTVVALITGVILKTDLHSIGEKIVTAVSTCICPVCAVLVTAASLFYNPNSGFFAMINRLFTGRTSLGHSALINYGVKLLGQNIIWTAESGKYNIVDSSYLLLAFDYGLVFMVVLLAMYTVLGYKAGKNKRWDLVLIIITVSLHAIVEGTLTNAVFNPAVIAIGFIFYEVTITNSIENQPNQ